MYHQLILPTHLAYFKCFFHKCLCHLFSVYILLHCFCFSLYGFFKKFLRIKSTIETKKLNISNVLIDTFFIENDINLIPSNRKSIHINIWMEDKWLIMDVLFSWIITTEFFANMKISTNNINTCEIRIRQELLDDGNKL